MFLALYSEFGHGRHRRGRSLRYSQLCPVYISSVHCSELNSVHPGVLSSTALPTSHPRVASTLLTCKRDNSGRDLRRYCNEECSVCVCACVRAFMCAW